MRANRQQVNAKVKRDTDKASVGEAAPQPAGNAGGGAGFIVLGANGAPLNPFGDSPFGGGLFGIGVKVQAPFATPFGGGMFGIGKKVSAPFSTPFGGGMFGIGKGVNPQWVSGSAGAGGTLGLAGFRVTFG